MSKSNNSGSDPSSSSSPLVISRQTSTLGRRRSNIPSLVCAFSASVTTGGTIYAFGIFANDLKHALHLTQLQLGAVSSAFFIAGLFSWIPGMVVDKMKMRFSMCFGGVSGAIFTITYWIACREPTNFLGGIMISYPVTILSILAVAISLSCGLIVGSVFKLTMLCGGREGRGPAVGIAKGFVGLGSGVYATIFQAFRNQDESALDFLPVIAFFFLLCAALPALLLLPTREESQPHLMKIETTPLHFRTMYLTLFILCLFIVTSALNDIMKDQYTEENGIDEDTIVGSGRQYGKVALILMLWLGPIASLLFLPRKEEMELASLLPQQQRSSKYGTLTPTEEDDEEEDNDDDDHQQEASSKPLLKNIIVDFRADLSLPEMLQTPSAWLMLWTTLILVGSGTSKTNNMGQMVESLGLEDAVTPATLAIFSVAQSAARIVTGIVSEAALRNPQYRLPRPVFLVIASSVALIGHLILAVASESLVAFVGGCTICAIAFGMAWPLMVLIVGDIFGVEHHGANYMFYDGGTKALGTIFLSEYVAGTVYQAHIAVDDVDAKAEVARAAMGGDEEDSLTCYGPECFQMTHLIIAGLAVTGILASLLLLKTSRVAYANKKY